MLVTENLKYAKHDEFSHPHEGITLNEQPIITQRIGNIDLIQETPSSQSTLKLYVNPLEKTHKSSLNTISILQHSLHDFIDVIGEYLESHFSQFLHSTIIYHLSS